MPQIEQDDPTKPDQERFVDHGLQVYDLADEFLVECPKCRKMGRVSPTGDLLRKSSDPLFAPRRFVCLSCLHRDDWHGKQVTVGGAVDWYFGLPLWLKIPCCGEVLWAYNLRHLEILESYVSAQLRERTNKGRNSFLNKLPKWILSAKNRDDILRAIGKLKLKTDGRN